MAGGLVAEAQDGAGGASVELLLYYYALDRGDVGGARQRLQKALCAGPSSGLAAAVYALEAAFFEAAVRGDRERGRVWLNRVGVGATRFCEEWWRGCLQGVAW